MLAEIETDKASMEWEAQEDGVLAQILVQEGTSGIQVGAPVFVQVDSVDDVDAFKAFTAADAGASTAPVGIKTEAVTEAPAMAAAPASTPAAPVSKAPSVPVTPRKAGERVVASPYARSLALENNVDLSTLQGYGPGGRIVAADVLGAPVGTHLLHYRQLISYS